MDSVLYDGIYFRKDHQDGFWKGRFRGWGDEYLLHERIYTAHAGKIPKGGEVYHLDGDKDNNTIENLRLRTQGEVLRAKGFDSILNIRTFLKSEDLRGSLAESLVLEVLKSYRVLTEKQKERFDLSGVEKILKDHVEGSDGE